MTELNEEQKGLLIEAEEEAIAVEETKQTEQAEQTEQAGQTEQAEQAAAATANIVIAVSEQLLTLVMPHVELDDAQKTAVAEKLTPVFVKYGSGNAPAWLVAYKEELALVSTLSLVAFNVYQQDKQYKLAIEEDKKKQMDPSQDQSQVQSVNYGV